jgi:hypothetical protein
MCTRLSFSFLIVAICLSSVLANAKSVSQFQTINTVESAPLSLVNRSFSRLEASLDDSVDPDLLTYRLRNVDDNVEVTIKGLLVNIAGGPSEATVTEFDLTSPDPRQIKLAVETFTSEISQMEVSENSRAQVLESLSTAIKAALARADVKLYSASVNEKNLETKFLIMLDEETRELLAISLSSATLVTP